jgi:hypothetical protein
MKIKISFFSVLIISILACSKFQIVGQWQGEKATVNGVEIQAKFENILMDLGADGSYQYKATDGYLERGRYRVDGHFFFTTDTLNKKQEKMVEIEEVSTTHLTLKMKNLRNEIQLLTLKKVN